MPVFVVVPLAADVTRLDDAVMSTIGATNRHQLQNGRGWLVQFSGTSVELSNHIGITGQAEGQSSATGSAMVAPISSYYGRGPNDMWEWLSLKFTS